MCMKLNFIKAQVIVTSIDHWIYIKISKYNSMKYSKTKQIRKMENCIYLTVYPVEIIHLKLHRIVDVPVTYHLIVQASGTVRRCTSPPDSTPHGREPRVCFPERVCCISVALDPALWCTLSSPFLCRRILWLSTSSTADISFQHEFSFSPALPNKRVTIFIPTAHNIPKNFLRTYGNGVIAKVRIVAIPSLARVAFEASRSSAVGAESRIEHLGGFGGLFAVQAVLLFLQQRTVLSLAWKTTANLVDRYEIHIDVGMRSLLRTERD